MKAAAVFTAVLLTLAALCVPVSASDSVYVALGDSIAYGYGLSDRESQCFTYLTADSLGLSLTNLAQNGMTSGGLLSLLQTASDEGNYSYDKLASASLITVTIGSNNLLGPLSDIWNSVMTANGGVYNDAAFAELEASLTSESAVSSFNDGISAYEADLPQIYSLLRAANPDAQIIMTRFYNPFYGVTLGSFDYSSMCDEYITRMNAVLDAGAQTMDYDLAETYTPFNAPGMTNVDAANGGFDPHPNIAGHIAIRDAVLAVANVSVPASQTETAAAEADAAADQTDAVSETSADSSAKSGSTGAYVLLGLAAVVFIVTGVIVTQRQKKLEKEKEEKRKNS